MNTVFVTALFAATLSLILGTLLGIFRKVFHVESDVLSLLIRETLPGANCGACGFPGCDGYASAVAAKEASFDKCTVSSVEDTQKRAELVGSSGGGATPVVAVVACQGTKECAFSKGRYTGFQSCRAAKISSNGIKVCAWGCMGFGDCVKVCAFNALSIGENGLPVVDREKCKGCKLCVSECPQGIIRLIGTEEKGVFAFCSNRSTVKSSVRKACKVGCMKCEACIKKCSTQAISLENGIPKIDYTKCTSCGECITKCPQKVLKLV